MRMKKLLVLGMCLALGWTVSAWAGPEELAKESEAKSAATASTKPTIAMITEKVNKACAILEKEGSAAFGKFKGKDSEFIFAGTYIWVHSMDGIMLMHPIKVAMEGKPVMAFKDPNGKRFFGEMNEVAKEKGAGWVDYMWPKPGEKTPELKVSYVKLCKMSDGKEVVVGCGVYNLSEAEIATIKGGK